MLYSYGSFLSEIILSLLCIVVSVPYVSINPSKRNVVQVILYKNNYPFFKRIYDSIATEIVFFGFSFGQVDLYYFKQLFAHVDTSNTKLLLSEYEDKNEKDNRLKIIRCLGFNGEYCGSLASKSK